MTSPLIPRKDADARDWMLTLARGIEANPGRYALSPADGLAVMQAVNEFSNAYDKAIDPAKRTCVTVANKDDARSAAESLCRVYAAIIKQNCGVTDSAKLAIGVRPKSVSHHRRDVPASSPLLSVIGASNGAHTLRYRDSFTPESSAKPFGAVCLQLFRDVTDGSRPPAVEQARFVGSFTHSQFGVAYESKDSGKSATYWGRWASRRGDTGPWSVPVSFTIAFGGAGTGGMMKTGTKRGPKHDVPPLRIEGEVDEEPREKAA